MITITRLLARQLRSIIRRAGFDKHAGSAKNWLALRAGADGLRIQAVSDSIAVEYRQPGEHAPEEFLVPRGLLAAVEGRSDEAVTFTHQESGSILVSWIDAGIPQIVEHSLTESAEIQVQLPQVADSLSSNPPGLLAALSAAADIVEQDATRYALDCLQLRGREGKVVATDGRQILVQSGFEFPWAVDVLVPAVAVFSCRELSTAQSVEVGMTDSFVMFRIGPWTIWLRINQEGRFPQVDDLFRSATAASSRLAVADGDAEFLQRALGRLPNDEALNGAITLELNGQALVRGKPTEGTRAVELILSRSAHAGEHVVVNTNRTFLGRALTLGFREISFFGSRSPALCDDGERQYLWALLEPDGISPHSDDVIRVESDAELVAGSAHHSQRNRRRGTIQPLSESNGGAATGRRSRTLVKANSHSQGIGCIDEALALRTALRASLSKTNELVRSLKRERRQSRLVASTLASLEQLQRVAS